MFFSTNDWAAYAFMLNPWSVWHTEGLPAETSCHFCQTKLDPLEVYAIIVDIGLYAHIGCIAKAVENAP